MPTIHACLPAEVVPALLACLPAYLVPSYYYTYLIFFLYNIGPLLFFNHFFSKKKSLTQLKKAHRSGRTLIKPAIGCCVYVLRLLQVPRFSFAFSVYLFSPFPPFPSYFSSSAHLFSFLSVFPPLIDTLLRLTCIYMHQHHVSLSLAWQRKQTRHRLSSTLNV